MSTEVGPNWVDLLRVARLIRSSVRPVTPSPSFRRHLRSDLATALGAPRSAPPHALVVRRSSPVLALLTGALLGLVAAAVVLAALHQAQTRQPQDHE